jgi:CrcB protein
MTLSPLFCIRVPRFLHALNTLAARDPGDIDRVGPSRIVPAEGMRPLRGRITTNDAVRPAKSYFPPMSYLAIALGGAVGSVLRYAVQTALRPASSGFPWGTLMVNLVGSFLIGLCAALAERQGAGSWIRPWLMVGLLGGFTTFSAFSLENVQMLRNGQAGLVLAYVLVSVAGGLALAFAGYMLART